MDVTSETLGTNDNHEPTDICTSSWHIVDQCYTDISVVTRELSHERFKILDYTPGLVCGVCDNKLCSVDKYRYYPDQKIVVCAVCTEISNEYFCHEYTSPCRRAEIFAVDPRVQLRKSRARAYEVLAYMNIAKLVTAVLHSDDYITCDICNERPGPLVTYTWPNVRLHIVLGRARCDICMRCHEVVRERTCELYAGGRGILAAQLSTVQIDNMPIPSDIWNIIIGYIRALICNAAMLAAAR